MNYHENVYPFAAIVGQEKMKLALLLNAVNPRIGGVLIRGDRGTAKSTAARALARLLPDIDVVVGCPFNCAPTETDKFCPFCGDRGREGETLEATTRRTPLVTLPLGSSEDRVIGSIDIESAIREGRKRFEPGVLASVNRGVLYVDEVNLLDDHLVDLLLDAAAMEVNTVEREGVSFSHPTRFILIGTMNPEEGELRPQLLDRFGLCVDIESDEDLTARRTIIKRRLAYEADPAGFVTDFDAEEKRLRRQLEEAERRLLTVACPDPRVDEAAEICRDMGADGHRADVTVIKTAATLAAFDGRDEARSADVYQAAELALPHRMRKRVDHRETEKRREFEEKLKDHQNQRPNPAPNDDSNHRDEKKNDETSAKREPDATVRVTFAPKPSESAPDILWRKRRTPRNGRGRGIAAKSENQRGRHIGSQSPVGPVSDVALDATLRAAAMNSAVKPANPADKSSTTDAKSAVSITPNDVRVKKRSRKVGALILFLVDGSGSMGTNQRMAAAKGAALGLLKRAYQQRHEVGMVVFQGAEATLVLPPTQDVDAAERRLTDLPTGGKTPLASGLSLCKRLLEKHRRRSANQERLLVVISDGKANVPINGDDVTDELKTICAEFSVETTARLVLDSESGLARFGRAKRLAAWLNADYVRLDDVSAESIQNVIHLD